MLEPVVLSLLLLVNALGVLLVFFQLPGTWLILIATTGVAWAFWDRSIIGFWPLILLLALAVLGELVESGAGAVASRRAGGSRRGALLSVVTAIAGAALGASLAGSVTFAFFWAVPLWLTFVILGGVAGAGAGALLGDRLAGRSWESARRSAFGAGLGRLWGTLAKLVVAAAMWLVVLFAILV